MAKKMFEQRQQMMKEFMEKGGESNPAALQEMMAKAAQLQQSAIMQMRAHTGMPLPSGNQQSLSASVDPTNVPSNDSNASGTGGSNVFIPGLPAAPTDINASMLNANLNGSKLDDLIGNNRAAANKKAKQEEEAKILEAIARKDYTQLNAVKATQYGVLERLKELIETNQCDPNKPDKENVYLLHWAAINNRIEIAKYLISLNCEVDSIGGELESSPLNWAARSGHIQMVVYLMQQGANPLNFDIEGFSTIHLATMFGHSIVVAYLLAKGLDADMKDRNGITPLMFAAQRVHSSVQIFSFI